MGQAFTYQGTSGETYTFLLTDLQNVEALSERGGVFVFARNAPDPIFFGQGDNLRKAITGSWQSAQSLADVLRGMTVAWLLREDDPKRRVSIVDDLVWAYPNSRELGERGDVRTIVVTGESGRSVSFGPLHPGDMITPIAGLILFARVDERNVVPLYIGESQNLHTFVSTTPWFERAVSEYGATHRYVHRGPGDPRDRRRMKADLVKHNGPVLNPPEDYI